MKLKPIFIKRDCLSTIARWSVCSKHEIAFYCFGRKRTVSHVVRLRNTARDPHNFVFVNLDELEYVKRRFKRRGLKLITEGHSHVNGLKVPSLTDWRWLDFQHEELIVAINDDQAEIRAFKIRRSYRKTLKKGQIPLIAC
jgi:proteasome lid subunit RPN8/RPN11